VKANPSAFKFKWEFNRMVDNVNELPSGRTDSREDISRFFYTPHNDSQFGTFLCWASNKIGRQVHACVFNVVIAGENFKGVPLFQSA